MSNSTLVGVERYANKKRDEDGNEILIQDEKGRKIQLLALTPEQTQALIESLSNFAETGALVRVAVEMRKKKDGSGEFPSSFLLVMENKSQDNAGASQKKVAFKPKTYGAPVASKPAAKPNTGYKPYQKQQTRLVDSGEE